MSVCTQSLRPNINNGVNFEQDATLQFFSMSLFAIHQSL